MYHSITFTNGTSVSKNTWADWHLIPSPPPEFDPPKVKTKYVDIPGSNGSMDLTEVFGALTYEDRTGTFTFYMTDQDTNWLSQMSTMMAFLHGRRVKAVLEDDPLYYYIGRFTVDKHNSQKNYSTITVGYQVSPFKYKIDSEEAVL